jgi:predicted nucleic acid-binding protein
MRTRVADAFFDTNVLVYLLSADASKADPAGELLERGGTVSVQVLNEFVAVAMRKLRMQIVEIREILATVRQLCEVISLDLATHDRALELVEHHRLSIFDALIVSAAIGAGCTTLWSEDLHHGHKIERLTIRNPFVA